MSLYSSLRIRGPNYFPTISTLRRLGSKTHKKTLIHAIKYTNLLDQRGPVSTQCVELALTTRSRLYTIDVSFIPNRKELTQVPHKIVSKSQLAENIFTADIEAPLIARARKPGQFVIVIISNEYSERIPLTIADADPQQGTIRLIWQRIGKTTAELADMKVGDELAAVAGPLGKPTHIKNFGTVVCVSGGIGSAPMLPIARALKKAPNKIITILGARTKDLLVLEDDFAHTSDELIITTDDGSYGRKALVTEPLKELCQRNPKPDQVLAIGPAIMMKYCCEVTKKFNIPIQVSLNTIMVDGTGMCGGCRIEYDGQPKFVCVDGPEFDGHKVNFDLMIKRLDAYKNQEQKAHRLYEKQRCKIGLDK
ncbi:MAG: sulfide/dihydroorotate dehydrogenase-like FAD/NAD-binding protein [Planctomycetota bacterium]|nr:MAG: sulfide/dihydroorotate dehydrogenase-like FAD/NAD-binding protein [Planctomycetota bacterium]